MKRIAACAIVLSLATPTLVAQTKPTAATSVSKTTAAARLSATQTQNPCVSKATPLTSRFRIVPLNMKAAASAYLKPHPVQQTMQQIDPLHAQENMAWQEASDEVMSMLEAKHPLDDGEKRQLADYDKIHPLLRDRFLYRAFLLRGFINNL